MIFIFKFISGLGNRLCNLMNMFYIHTIYPHATYYVLWLENHHCGANVSDLLDLSEYSWIRYDYDTIRPRYKAIELYAHTSIQQRTRWDTLDEWKKHPAIVSTTHHLYLFVPLSFCQSMFATLKYTPSVRTGVQANIAKYGLNRNICHFRKGDLLRLLDAEVKCYDRLVSKVKRIQETQDVLTIEYNKLEVVRPRDTVIESFSDMLFFAYHCNVIAFSPYSWFSSWIYLLNKKYSPEIPVFNYTIIDIITIGIRESL